LIKSVQAQGGTDRVDLSYTFEFPDANGEPTAFDKVEFSAPGHDDDYLINEISYTEVIDPEITNISTTDGKVTFNIQVDENYPPQGQAKAIVEVNGQEYEVDLNATGRGALTVDAKDFDDLSDINIVVKEIVGGNYEKVNGTDSSFDLSDSFKDDLSSTDDKIIIDEDTTYTLTETDFGELGIGVEEIKITDLPENGTLYYKVKEGQIVIDKEGNTYEATEDSVVELSENQIISLADIAAGNITFVPNSDSDIDSNFEFEISDGNVWDDTTYTTTIEVKAVADAPTASISVSDATIKVVDSTFDYDSYVQSLKSNADKIVDGNDTVEQLSGGEWNTTNDFIDGKGAVDHLDGYDGNDVFVGGAGNDHISGGITSQLFDLTDGLDTAIYTGEFKDYNISIITDGTNPRVNIIDNRGIDTSNDTNHSNNGDNLNSIERLVFKDGVYEVVDGKFEKVETKVLEYDVDISAALADVDGSETLTVKIDGVPNDATLESINDNYNITKNSDGSYSVEVPADATSISDNLKLKVPEDSAGDFNLTITARSTESNDNEDGTNYKESTDSDALLYSSDESKTLDFGQVNVNLAITIDISNSMADDNKLALAKQAIINMINNYDDAGNVKVLLTTFGDYGNTLSSGGEVWLDANTAINLINNLQADGGTNYDDALLKVIDSLKDNPAPLNGETISYFVSDGKPTYGMSEYNGTYYRHGNGYSLSSVNDDIAAQWKDLGFDKAYSIGIGDNSITTYLEEISNSDNNVIIVNNADDLDVTLQNTVESTIHGDVSDNITGGDGEKTIDSIVVDGVTHTVSEATDNVLSLNTNAGGTLKFNFETGEYSYSGTNKNIVEDKDSFTVNASDEDGDTTSFDVNINITNTIDNVASAPSLYFRIEDNGSQEIENNYNYEKCDSSLYGESYTNSNDYVNIKNDVKGWLGTFDGDDVVNVGDDVILNGNIDLGKGDDFITIKDKVGSYLDWVKIDGGEGNDSIYLKGYTINDYYKNEDNIQNKISNFENIKFKDGTVWGDASVFNTSPLSTTVYNYTITLAALLSDVDGSESLSKVTLDNIPDTITSVKDSSGNVYEVSGGTVQLPIEDAKEEEFTFVSTKHLESSEVNSMTASVTSTESENDAQSTVTTSAKISIEGDEHANTITGTDANEHIDGKGGADIIDAGAGDDEIIYHEDDIIDAGEGEDTLKVLTDEDIDLSNIAPKVDNIEAIDLTNDLANHIIVDEQSIEDLTDDENILKIFGDESGEDSVRLEGNWTKSDGQISDDDGNTFNVYEGTTSGTSNIKILIDEDVSVDPDI